MKPRVLPQTREEAVRRIAERLLDWTGLVLPDCRLPLLRAHLERLGRGDPIQGAHRILQGDPTARQHLMDALSVPETYLFRHPGHFEALRRLALDRRQAGRHCHVLSAGCATGEEVWSAAAVLADVFLPASRGFSVTGCDLAAARVEYAGRGVYRDWSTRHGFLHYARFFSRDGDGWRVAAELRPFARFKVVNLVRDELGPEKFYDAIFLRNVAIYWELATTAQVVGKLLACLAPDGVFFPGPTDPVHLDRTRWEYQDVGTVRAYRRASEKPAKPLAAPPPAPPVSRAATRTPPRTPAPEPAWVTPVAAAPDPFSEVQALADAGDYRPALDRLREVRLRNPEACFWEGVLLLNLEQPEEAVRAFRQSVYFGPEEARYRHWLATALELLGRTDEAARETRAALELEMKP
ncbi:MAG: hypothetical protein HY319_25965 [Armatimonadetes bacterium]|nr:hypothetical protein [Armatimonadota bacterium]